MKRFFITVLVFVLLTNIYTPAVFSNEVIGQSDSELINSNDGNEESAYIDVCVGETVDITANNEFDDDEQLEIEGSSIENNPCIIEDDFIPDDIDPLEKLFREIEKYEDPNNQTTIKYIVKLKQDNTLMSTSFMSKSVTEPLLFDAITLDLNTRQVNHIISNDLVESLEIDQKISIAETDKTEMVQQELKANTQTIPWGIHSTGAYLVNSMDPNGESVKVAVFDTGISEHFDLSVVGGISTVDYDSSYIDNNGHGTHIAGIIAAQNNSTGIVGFSNNIELYSVKVLDSTGDGYISSVIRGIEWAISNDINIINMSFVSSEYSEILNDAIRIAAENNILIVAAAGNGGLGDNTVQYPARYTDVISVGAVDSYHNRANFSATGPDLDLVAPGVNVLSTMNESSFGTYSGTSQAAAHVTGAMALLWSSNKTLLAQEVKETILGTATELGTPNMYGMGLINVAKAKGVIAGSIAPIGNLLENGGEEIYLPGIKSEADIEIASFDKYGDGMVYEPGQLAKVGLKLEGDQNGQNPHSQVIIELYEATNPTNIIKSQVINNPTLNQNYEFIWQIPVNTAVGQYHIKYSYPAYPDGSWDDVFVIVVMQSGLGPDTYEPNDTFVTAYSVVANRTYTSYISTVSDNDYYKFVAPKTGTVDVNLRVPADKDYNLQVYDEDGFIIEYNPTGIGQDENVTVTLTKGSTYYFRVFGFYGDFGVEPYLLTLSNVNETLYPAPSGLVATVLGDSIKVTWNSMPNAIEYIVQLDGEFNGFTDSNSFTIYDLDPMKTYTIGVAAVYEVETSTYTTIRATTSIPELYVNQTKSVVSTNERIFKFTSPTTGIYKVYTSPLYNIAADTIINVYSDANLSKLIYSNDDDFDSTFSSIQMSLTGGSTYYIKLSWFGVGEQSANITAITVHSTVPFIELNETIDIDEKVNSTVYVFIPERSGLYKVTTDFYGGIATARENDTIIEMFSDFNMTRAVNGGKNDDTRDSLFSEVNVSLTQNVPYYIRIKEVTGSGVYARLQVSTSGDVGFSPLVINQEETVDLQQNQEGFYKYIPTYTGKYRIFTSSLIGESLADTVVEIYSDPDLLNLVGMNDDVNGKALYGTTYSKIELTLQANSTYYIVVKSYDPRKAIKVGLMVEETLNSSKEDAMVIEWGQLVTHDTTGNNISISSLYDVDYYFIQLYEDSQVYISASSGMGLLENINGRIMGYFSEGGDSVFNLSAGSYYIKVQDNFFGGGAVNNPPYDYELIVEINDIFIDSDYEESSLLSRASNNSSTQILDPTPGKTSIKPVTWNYKNKTNSVKIKVEIRAKTTFGERLVYSKDINGNKRTGDITVITWNGNVNQNVEFASRVGTTYGNYYYAKDGLYNIYVYEYSTNSKSKLHQVASVVVMSNPLDPVNFVPMPPKKGYDSKKKKTGDITSQNKENVQATYDYYYRYIMPADLDVPLTGYDAWAKEVYGLNGIQQFWQYSSNLIYNPNESLTSNVQRMLDMAGMIPVVGEGADAINGTIYFIRGDNANAVLSIASMVPVLGTGVGGTRVAKLMKVEHVIESCMELNCMKEAYKDINKHSKQKSQNLATELGKVVKKPDIVDGIKDWQAHHIIPKSGKGVFVQLQNKINKVGVDLHSAANGVWLPVKAKTEFGAVDLFQITNSDTLIVWTVTAHKKHSEKYGDYLWARLKDVTTSDQALHEINEVRKLLLSGELTLANPKK